MSAKPRDLGMTPLDDLFSTDESRAEAQLEKVVTLNPADISDFPNHPFKVKQDEAMAEMVDSVKQYGVLVPALVRPKADGGYEMVAGHRRKCAATLAGITEMPCIVRNLTDDEATIIMVDSNLQRETILPSEKAFAYKMKLEAKREFAVLRSVGMTVNKLFAMLCIENLRNGLLAILIGGISSLPLCYLIYKSIVVGAVIDFVFPLGAFVISSLAMFLIMFLTSLYGLWKIKNGDIIADVRNDFV